VGNYFKLQFERERESKRGLPIGNLTSQIFANVYLNELDGFIKHRLGVRFYLRYCDDFIILDNDIPKLENYLGQIQFFLQCQLSLKLHPSKIIIRKLKQGIDFLGYVNFADYRILRTKTKRRMLKRICVNNLPSYLGFLRHCNSYKLRQEVDYLTKNINFC